MGDREWSAAGHQHADRVIAAYSSTFATLPRAKAVRLAHRLIDDAHRNYQRVPGSVKIACRTDDCFSCCLFQKGIETVDFEVNKILDQVEREGRLSDVVRRAKRLVDSGKGGACPLLSKDGKCTVYKNRPLSCASMHSLNRELCKDPKGKTVHSEQLWVETHIIAGFGMLGPAAFFAGMASELTVDLFERLAVLGGKRLRKKEAA